VDAPDARRLLEEERRRLLAVKAHVANDHLDDESADESAAQLSHMAQHQADAGTDTFEREKDFSILEQIESELHDVELALRHLDEGTYGRCEQCHEPIGDDRLEAIPAARFCVTHQHLAEGVSPGPL
jgi:RNA polymerase-binding transcription factor DksA